uniref:guanylate cyclase n=1 Tax=Phallusia mammillata TaxID=59560 RepID=A0A6F9DEZ0_9ASCI|nr:guanylate cyclase soluble subunit alpha-2-like [Phallusia mammillata]
MTLSVPQKCKHGKQKKVSSDSGYYSESRSNSGCTPPLCLNITPASNDESFDSKLRSSSKKASIDGLRECLLNITMPSELFMRRTFFRLLQQYDTDIYDRVRTLIKQRMQVDVGLDDPQRYNDKYPSFVNSPLHHRPIALRDNVLCSKFFDQRRILHMICCLAEIINTDFMLVARRFGKEMAAFLYHSHRNSISSIGNTLEKFINTIDGLTLHLLEVYNNSHTSCATMCSYRGDVDCRSVKRGHVLICFPANGCSETNTPEMSLKFSTPFRSMSLFVGGLIEEFGKLIFKVNVEVVCGSETAANILVDLAGYIDIHQRNASHNGRKDVNQSFDEISAGEGFGRIDEIYRNDVIVPVDQAADDRKCYSEAEANKRRRLGGTSGSLQQHGADNGVYRYVIRESRERTLPDTNDATQFSKHSPLWTDDSKHEQHSSGGEAISHTDAAGDSPGEETQQVKCQSARKRPLRGHLQASQTCTNLILDKDRISQEEESRSEKGLASPQRRYSVPGLRFSGAATQKVKVAADSPSRDICELHGNTQSETPAPVAKISSSLKAKLEGVQFPDTRREFTGDWSESNPQQVALHKSEHHKLVDIGSNTESMDGRKGGIGSRRQRILSSRVNEFAASDVSLGPLLEDFYADKVAYSRPAQPSNIYCKNSGFAMPRSVDFTSNGGDEITEHQDRLQLTGDEPGCPFSALRQNPGFWNYKMCKRRSQIDHNDLKKVERRFRERQVQQNGTNEFQDSMRNFSRISKPPTDADQEPLEKQTHKNESKRSNPSCRIGVATFCRAFPFHLVFNRQMHLLQVGTAILRVMDLKQAAQIVGGAKRGGVKAKFTDHFQITTPTVQKDLEFLGILELVNEPFTIQLKNKNVNRNSQDRHSSLMENMEIRGGMLFVKEQDCLLFMGSPNLHKLDELRGTGIFISDIPIHDATRDVILVGEQAKAQESLKRRMDKLRASLEENNNALEQERRLNVELLYSIFPADIAENLWLGKQVKARQLKDITMLFSDIVGFTSICSSCSPMEVISMLSNLYVQFDRQCGIHDVYKVETIGDAYCVAGGLHCQTKTHAHQIAWMALFMIRCAQTVYTPTGIAITMRIGIHTGSVVTGVVGTRMPRYCLFGNNVTLANRFESHSEGGKIYVSPTTHKLLQDDPGFKFSARKREDLPKGFPSDIPGVGYFLNKYEPKLDTEVTSTLGVSRQTEDGVLETDV